MLFNSVVSYESSPLHAQGRRCSLFDRKAHLSRLATGTHCVCYNYNLPLSRRQLRSSLFLLDCDADSDEANTEYHNSCDHHVKPSKARSLFPHLIGS